MNEEQKARVEYLTEAGWWDDETDEPDWQAFDRAFSQITDAEELNGVAEQHNWDDGLEVLQRILEHPLCDRGTALMVYWRGEPTFYAKYKDKEEAVADTWSDTAELWDFLRMIEKKMQANEFATGTIAYNPKDDGGYDATKPGERTAAKLEERGQVLTDVIPAVMLEAVEGKIPAC